ncbi:MAG: DUF1207 domain-containing protein [Planctomycetia bacterium]|nr:DUF1207 domain-containing protein [Planctomycetia bacterium]
MTHLIEQTARPLTGRRIGCSRRRISVWPWCLIALVLAIVIGRPGRAAAQWDPLPRKDDPQPGLLENLWPTSRYSNLPVAQLGGWGETESRPDRLASSKPNPVATDAAPKLVAPGNSVLAPTAGAPTAGAPTAEAPTADYYAPAAPAGSGPAVLRYNGTGLPGQRTTPLWTGQTGTDSDGGENVAHEELPQEASPWGWQILPKSLIYQPYLAGVKEPRLGAVLNDEQNRGWILDLTAGARVGLLRHGTPEVFEPDGWQLDIEGAAFPRLDPRNNMDMEATDYRFGVPLTYGWGRYQMKIAYFHLSSHLGDEYAIRNGLSGRLNYSRDAFVWGHSYDLSEAWRVYFEAGWAFHSDVNEPWDMQFGIEYSPRCNVGPWGTPFVATNAHLRQESNFGGNFVFQVGWQWNSAATGNRMRIGVQYYNGQSEQYEFFSTSEQKVGLGVWYDF